jgi:hypothetical protein
MDRAAYAAGNIGSQCFDTELANQGVLILKKLAYSKRQNRFIYRAIINYAGQLILNGDNKDRTEGYRLLDEFPKEAPEAERFIAVQYRKDYSLILKEREKQVQLQKHSQKGSKQ